MAYELKIHPQLAVNCLQTAHADRVQGSWVDTAISKGRENRWKPLGPIDKRWLLANKDNMGPDKLRPQDGKNPSDDPIDYEVELMQFRNNGDLPPTHATNNHRAAGFTVLITTDGYNNGTITYDDKACTLAFTGDAELSKAADQLHIYWMQDHQLDAPTHQYVDTVQLSPEDVAYDKDIVSAGTESLAPFVPILSQLTASRFSELSKVDFLQNTLANELQIVWKIHKTRQGAKDAWRPLLLTKENSAWLNQYKQDNRVKIVEKPILTPYEVNLLKFTHSELPPSYQKSNESSAFILLRLVYDIYINKGRFPIEDEIEGIAVHLHNFWRTDADIFNPLKSLTFNELDKNTKELNRKMVEAAIDVLQGNIGYLNEVYKLNSAALN